MQLMPLLQAQVMQLMPLLQAQVMQLMPLLQAQVMQLMPLLQAIQEQVPAIKLSAAHLPYMVVEAANRPATFEYTSMKQPSNPTSAYCIQTWLEQSA
jgi:hypothetical protein